MTWDILNSLWRVLLVLVVAYKLTQFREMMIAAERIGLGLMGGGSLMTVSIIWEHRASPFDGWAVSVMTIGAVVFLMGRTWRDRRHQRANDRQIQYWEAHKAGKRGI